MASSTQNLLADFREMFPEFGVADYTDDVVVGWIETARAIHALSDRALIWCAAHLLALDRDEGRETDGGAGIIQSESIGPMRLTFQTQAKDQREVFFSRTSYGRMFLQLEHRTPAMAMAVRVY